MVPKGIIESNSHRLINLGTYTPPKPSEISEKNWCTYLDEAIFDIPFMIHAESMKKILGAI